jgi:hypothetical protein
MPSRTVDRKPSASEANTRRDRKILGDGACEGTGRRIGALQSQARALGFRRQQAVSSSDLKYRPNLFVAAKPKKTARTMSYTDRAEALPCRAFIASLPGIAAPTGLRRAFTGTRRALPGRVSITTDC